MYYKGKLGQLKKKNYENYKIKKKKVLVNYVKNLIFEKRLILNKNKYFLNNLFFKLIPIKVYNNNNKFRGESFLELKKKKALFLNHYDFNLNYKNIIGTENIYENCKVKKKNNNGCFIKLKNTIKKKKNFINIKIKKRNKINFFYTITRLIVLKKKNIFNYFSNRLNYYYGFLWKRDSGKASLTMKIAKNKNKKGYTKQPYSFFFYGDTDDIYIKNKISFKKKNDTIPGLLKIKKKVGNIFYKKKRYMSAFKYNKTIKIFKKGI